MEGKNRNSSDSNTISSASIRSTFKLSTKNGGKVKDEKNKKESNTTEHGSLMRSERGTSVTSDKKPTTGSDKEKSKGTKGGFLNIFKWFSKKDVKHTQSFAYPSRDDCSNSTVSLTNSANSSSFIPLKHSVSADDAEGMRKAYRTDVNNSMPENVSPTTSALQDSQCARRGSVGSSYSESSVLSDMSQRRSRKRMAPTPPSAAKHKDETLTNLQKSCDDEQLGIDKNGGSVYSKLKRKAPLPPCTTPEIIRQQNSDGSYNRPASTFSDFSSLSLSTNSTLRSTSCSEDGISNSSELSKSNPLFPVLSDKEPLSPKPWYKRKKIKSSKDKKKNLFKKGKEVIYDTLMPDIQFARPKCDIKGASLPNTGHANLFSGAGFQDKNRFSILSTISDLDRAAAEHIQREKAQKQAAKVKYDKSFYTASAHILNQEDIAPKIPKNTHCVVNDRHSQDESEGAAATYDNLQLNNSYAAQSFIHSEHSAQKLSENSAHMIKENMARIHNSSLVENFVSDAEIHEIQSLGINYDEYLEEIRREVNETAEEASNSNSGKFKETPMRRAVFDSELFYQLAKDAKVTCGKKLASLLPTQEPSPVKSPKQIEILSGKKSPLQKRLPKHFGFRMNNFFTPDVSIILEGSESVTSTNTRTTPADDVPTTTTGNLEMSNDFMSMASDLNSEFRINTCDLQDLIESFTVDQKRAEDDNARRDGKELKSKAEKIREEVLLLREKDNFLAWQRTVEEIEQKNKYGLLKSLERKDKWACKTCTLVNQPWRLHCEACGTIKPPNSEAMDNQHLRNPSANSSAPNTISDDSPETVIMADESEFNNDACNSSIRPTETVVTPNSNWENELQDYISIFDNQANSIKTIDIGAVRNQLFNCETVSYSENPCSEYGIINVSSNGSKCSPDMSNERGVKPKLKSTPYSNDHIQVQVNSSVDIHQLRQARLRRFEQLQRSFENSLVDDDNHSNMRQGRNVPTSTIQNGDTVGVSKIVGDSESIFPVDENKKFYKNDYKKSSPVMKPSGAVKNVVSIFNQLDQLNQAGQNEKPAPVKAARRKMCSAFQAFRDFENLFNNNVDSSQNVPRCVSPIKADIDISSAINKFDEMAAMAEIEKINKPTPRATKVREKFCIPDDSEQSHRSENSYQNGTGAISNSASAPDLSHQASRTDLENNKLRVIVHDATKPVQRRAAVLDNEIVIKDGILYTAGEARKRSMSIGSGTFELLNARDFADIEAHHSRRPSPADDTDAPSLLELNHPLLMPEITNHRPESSVNTNISYVKGKAEEERICEELTDSSGIANFKAKLKQDEAQLGESNTATIIGLLKRLERAIAEGKHMEASHLAKEVAKLRLSGPLSNNSSEKGTEKCNSGNMKGEKINANDNFEEDNTELRISGYASENNECTSGRSIESSYKTSSEGSSTPTTSESSSHAKDITSNVTDDVYLSVNCSENSLDSEMGEAAAEVVKRSSRVNPSRRKVKSDVTNDAAQHLDDLEHNEEESFNVKMYVEDKSSHQGPIIISVLSSMTVGELKTKVSEEFGFPCEVQRWILGRLLADDDSRSLAFHNVTANGCPVFLYLVAPEAKRSSKPSRTSSQSTIKDENSLEKAEKLDSTKPKLPVNQQKKPVSEFSKPVSGKRTKAPEPKMNIQERPSSSRQHENSSDWQNHHKVDFTALDRLSSPQAEYPDEPQSLTKIDGWTCPRCTLINTWQRPGCEACTTERPQLQDSYPQSKRQANLKQAMAALDSQGCVPNVDPFECLVCFTDFESEEGVVLRDCLHQFCRDCLASAIKYSDRAAVMCPFRNRNYSCQFSLQEREIRDLLTEEEYKKHLDKSVKEAAGAMKNVFYCKTPDCKGFCQYEDTVNDFFCHVCNKLNCLTCQAQHGGITCKQYQDELANKQDEATLKTKKFFDDIIRRGDGMFCPQCSVMLVRKWGCDWMRCPMCRTEICWVTQGPRWGPEGQGDTSGGCRCGINGRKCHPKCTYCH